MALSKLTQQRILKTTTLELRENGVFVRTNSFSSSVEEEMPYENFGNNFIRITEKNSVSIASGVVFGIISALALGGGNQGVFTFFFTLSIFSFILAVFTSRHIIQIPLKGNRALDIFANKPDSETVESFLTTLKSTTKEYLLRKYVPMDKDIPLERQLEALIWLRNGNFLNEEEFNDLKLKLLKINPDSKIGF